MSVEYISLAILMAMIVMMILGFHLAFITGSIAIVSTLLVIGPNGLPLIAARMYTFVTTPALMAVPMLYSWQHLWSDLELQRIYLILCTPGLAGCAEE